MTPPLPTDEQIARLIDDLATQGVHARIGVRRFKTGVTGISVLLGWPDSSRTMRLYYPNERWWLIDAETRVLVDILLIADAPSGDGRRSSGAGPTAATATDRPR